MRPKKRIPTHPGRILAEHYLKPLSMSICELARRLKVLRPGLSMIVNGLKSIGPEMALRLGRAFNTTAEFWMNLQCNYDLCKAEQASGAWREVKSIVGKKLPKFKSVEEEAEFWEKNCVTKHLDELKILKEKVIITAPRTKKSFSCECGEIFEEKIVDLKEIKCRAMVCPSCGDVMFTLEQAREYSQKRDKASSGKKMNHEDAMKKLLEDPKVKAEYDRLGSRYEKKRALIKERIERNRKKDKKL